MLVAVPPSHAFATRDEVFPLDLNGESFIGFAEDLRIRRELDRFSMGGAGVSGIGGIGSGGVTADGDDRGSISAAVFQAVVQNRRAQAMGVRSRGFDQVDRLRALVVAGCALELRRGVVPFVYRDGEGQDDLISFPTAHREHFQCCAFRAQYGSWLGPGECRLIWQY